MEPISRPAQPLKFLSDTPRDPDFLEEDPLDGVKDHDEFVRLFTNNRRRIYAYIYTLVPITSEAEDIFQQTSLTLWRRFCDRAQGDDFLKWACGIAYYTIMNHRRKQRRSKLIFSDALFEKLAEQRTEWATTQAERSGFLRECLGRLRTVDRKLVARVYHDGLTAQQVAEETGRTRQGVYNRLSFIRKRLLECVNTRIAASGHSE